VRSLKSPVSLREWHIHTAIRNISVEEDDPEEIFIDAQPPDVETYIRTKELLSGLQTELDASWAVLGEAYGRHDRLRELQLSLRRVRSNLDDVTSFAKTVSYIPARASFEPAGVEMLRLLIKPLYHEDVHARRRHDLLEVDVET
jgi:hypothetical protein